MGERWTSTGQLPPRMKEEIAKQQQNVKHCTLCGDPKHQTRDHDKVKRAELKTREVVRQKPVAPFKHRKLEVVRKSKPRFIDLEPEKPVLTHRARRMARKAFPKKPHDWRFHPLIPEVKA